jgi:hypothetical protein
MTTDQSNWNLEEEIAVLREKMIERLGIHYPTEAQCVTFNTEGPRIRNL